MRDRWPAFVGSNDGNRFALAHDLVLPTVLFAALGGMTWAVRGCSGFGSTAGCIFAGVTWGAAWWFIAQAPEREQSRRYASGWIVAALTLGIGLSGARGWMQWPSFFRGQLVTDAAHGASVPISPAYGFLWLFIAGVPWAGLGACLLAWTGSLRETRVWHWVARIACGVGVALLARYLFYRFPQIFLPLYGSLEAQYLDHRANPNLLRLSNDCREAITHLGYYVGFLLYEVLRRDWKNVVLIVTVGVINGGGWALCQNWEWAPGVWPDGRFNWWRCWESSGGISIGIAYGVAYFLVNRKMSVEEKAALRSRRSIVEPSFEWLLVYLALTSFLSVYLRTREIPWRNIYCAVVMAIGAIYYLVNRRKGANQQPHRMSWSGMYAAAGTVGLTAALIAGLYLQGRAPELLRLLYPGAGAGEGRVVSVFNYLYPTVVIVIGIGWYVLGYRSLGEEQNSPGQSRDDPNVERSGLYLGLLVGLGLSVRNGLKGWFNIYRGDEAYWNGVLWQIFGPVLLICLIGLALLVLLRPLPRDLRGAVFPRAYGLMWLVLIVQNVIAQFITGPLTNWVEVVFSIYYILLFLITATIVFHFHTFRSTAFRGTE
jgi:hypothetical protein